MDHQHHSAILKKKTAHGLTSWWLNQPILNKCLLVKLDSISPKIGVKIKIQYLEPPPSLTITISLILTTSNNLTIQHPINQHLWQQIRQGP